MKTNRRQALGKIVLSISAIACLGLPSVSVAKQNNFPNATVNIISPYAPGGINDIVARLLGKELSDQFDEPVVVLNRTGAGGAVGAGELARAKPDGYTMMLGALGPLGVTKLITPSLSYDPRDFTPIIEVGRAPMILAVNTDLGIDSAQELLENIKKEPGMWNYGSAGIGSPQHLSGALFNQITGTEITHVAYRGSGPATNAVASGEVQITFENLPPLLPHLQSGKIKPLAVLAAERMSTLPDVPTIKEIGIDNLEVSGWYGFVAPENTPKQEVNILYQATKQALEVDDIKKRMQEFGIVVTGHDGEQFGELIRNEYDRWQPIIEELDIQPE